MKLVSGLDIMNIGRSMVAIDGLIEELGAVVAAETKIKRMAAIRKATDGLHGSRVTAGTLEALRRRILEEIESLDAEGREAAA